MGSIEKFGNSQEEQLSDAEQTTGWENMAEDVEKAKEEQLSDTEQTSGQENAAEDAEQAKGEQLSEDEQAEVEYFKDWYANAKQENPDAPQADFHKTIISGLGYNLGIPGYGLGDLNNPDAKPTEEQQARLEELYKMVVGEEKSE